MQSVLIFLAINAALAAVLAVVVLLLTAVVRRPAFANRAWLIVVLKLITPPMFVVPILWPAGTSEPPSSFANDLRNDAPILRVVGVIEYGADAQATLNAARNGESFAASSFDWALWIFVLWLAGAVGWWSMAAQRLMRFRRLLDFASSPANAQVRAEVAVLAGQFGLRSVPQVDWLDAELPPMVWAIGRRPRILLPRRLWERLDGEQRSAVLAHELAHLRRGDHWVRRLELVVLGLYWWCPLVWWLRKRIEQAEEACCDAWVLWALPGSAEVYANALVETVSYLSRPEPVPLLASGAGRAKGLKRRLMMILQRPQAHRLSWLAAVALLTFAVLVLPWQFGVADTPIAPKANPPTVPTTTPAVGSSTGAPATAPTDPFATTTPRASEPKTNATPIAVGPKSVGAAPMGGLPGGVGGTGTYSGMRGAISQRELDELRDEIELLEAQRDIKRAQLDAANIAVRSAERSLGITEEAAKKGIASVTELNQLRAQVEAATAQRFIREAELKEQDVKITQAKRRLAALMPNAPAPKTSSSAPPATTGQSVPKVGGTSLSRSMLPPQDVPRLSIARPNPPNALNVEYDFGSIAAERVKAQIVCAVDTKALDGQLPKVKRISPPDAGFEVSFAPSADGRFLKISCIADGTQITGKRSTRVTVELEQPAGEHIQLTLSAERKAPETDATLRELRAQMEALQLKLAENQKQRSDEVKKLTDEINRLQDRLKKQQ